MAKAFKLIRKASQMIEDQRGYSAARVFEDTIWPPHFIPQGHMTYAWMAEGVYSDYLDEGERTDYRKVAARFLEAWDVTEWTANDCYTEIRYAMRRDEIKDVVRAYADVRRNR
jgi:hypothetical protein